MQNVNPKNSVNKRKSYVLVRIYSKHLVMHISLEICFLFVRIYVNYVFTDKLTLLGHIIFLKQQKQLFIISLYKIVIYIFCVLRD